MAKSLLWFMVILGFILGIITYNTGEKLELFTKILIWSGVGVLAICESIEKSKEL